MAMPPCGTFDYVTTVPERAEDADFECRGQEREPITISGSDLRDSRLVGLAPRIVISDAGLTPDAGPLRPWVMRSRITLSATRRGHATVAVAWFHIDKALTSRMAAGDQLHLTRTSSGGLGLSVVRSGELVYAVGAIGSVPLGRRVRTRYPAALIQSAERSFRKRDRHFRFRECPIEVSVGDSRWILQKGRRTIEDYEVHVMHGYLYGEPGKAACGAIYRKGQCCDVAAQASAMLMDEQDLSLSRWGNT